MKAANKDTYYEWLKTHEWDYFITLTAPYKLTSNSGMRMMERFYQRVLLDSGSPVKLFWVVDRFAEGGHYHVHCLLMADLRPDELERIYRRVANIRGYCRVQIIPFDPTRGAIAYCTSKMNRLKDNYDFIFSEEEEV